MIEMLIATFLSFLAILGAVSVYLTGMFCMSTGGPKTDNYELASRTGRFVADKLSNADEATPVNGTLLIIQNLETNTDGSMVMPPTPNPEMDSFTLSHGTLYFYESQNAQGTSFKITTLAQGVTTVDPVTGINYPLFAPTPGQVVRAVTVKFWIKTSSGAAPFAQVVRLRNLQEAPL